MDYSDSDENFTERNRELMEIGGNLLSIVEQLQDLMSPEVEVQIFSKKSSQLFHGKIYAKF